MNTSRVTVYHTLPLCGKCKEEVSKVKKTSEQRESGVEVKFSLWKRLKYGLQLMNMPIVVIDDKPFSVLGAFKEEALSAELDKGRIDKKKSGREAISGGSNG